VWLFFVFTHIKLADPLVIEKLLKRDIPKKFIAGYDIDPSIKAEPIQNGRIGQSRGRQQQRKPSARKGNDSPWKNKNNRTKPRRTK